MKNSHSLLPEILKECDIRGIYNKELFKEDAYYVGLSFGTYLIRQGKKTCIVGRDGRLSSNDLSTSIISGLNQTGIDVIDAGIVPTPAVYFGVHGLDISAGVMVTASHNPPEYNGFKFLTDENSFYGNDIQMLNDMCRSGDFAEGCGNCVPKDIKEIYVEYIYSFFSSHNRSHLKIVWDPGNGAMGVVLPDFLKLMPGTHKIICGEVDGTFPNHHPDPSVLVNTAQLRKTIIREKADLGIAFDGDGDRLGVVDSKGRLLNGDQLLLIFAREFLKESPGSTVMSEVKASQFLYDEIFAMGGKPLMWKVGHNNQKEKMKQKSIGLAGETSGHMFFQENEGFDDGLFAAVKLLNILMKNDETLAQIVDKFPKFHDSGEIRIALPTDKRHTVISQIKATLRSMGKDHHDIDGIRKKTEEGFWVIRSSNTQPHLTIRCEARTKQGYQNTIIELKEILLMVGIEEELFSDLT